MNLLFITLIIFIISSFLLSIRANIKNKYLENKFLTFISDIDIDTWIKNKDIVEDTLNKKVLVIKENKENPKLKEILIQ